MDASWYVGVALCVHYSVVAFIFYSMLNDRLNEVLLKLDNPLISLSSPRVERPEGSMRSHELWYESHNEVLKADCQIIFLMEGAAPDTPKTEMIASIKFKDGSRWCDYVIKGGGDFRKNNSMLIESSQNAFKRMMAEKCPGIYAVDPHEVAV